MSKKHFSYKVIKYNTSVDTLISISTGVSILLLWEIIVKFARIPPYLLPSPSLVLEVLISDWFELFTSLLVTLKVTVVALTISVISGLLIAILFTQNKWLAKGLLPYTVILQTTPIAAIIPLIIIWTKSNTFLTLVICAWLAAFFPILSNTILGLRSTDKYLLDLMRLYNASSWKTLLTVRLPYAMPYFLGGVKISSGLALVGSVVAEFVAGTGGAQSGIAYQILMASYNLQVPRMFAALIMTAGLGITLFIIVNFVSDLMLRRWHESAIPNDE
jgi:NitT/TauT family transport system permease protein